MYIERVNALEILDSRGNPTVLSEVITSGGFKGVAAAPSGASTGTYEAFELRDNEERYGGKGVRKAVDNVNTIINDILTGEDVTNQKRIDRLLTEADGTENKSRLGANAILSVSMACVKAAADFYGLEPYKYLGGIQATQMPLPMMNILNGGAHAANNLDVQEFMIIPSGAETFSEGLRMCAEVYHSLKKILSKNDYMTAVGDEGGFAPNLSGETEAIELIIEAIEKSNYKAGSDINIGLDAAANEWYKDGIYLLPKKGREYTSSELVSYWQKLLSHYPVISLEDPFAEDDWDAWSELNKNTKIQIVGDDLYVTNYNRLITGIEKKSSNAILIKPNQTGTVSETIDTVMLAKKTGFGTIISHRSGETEDTFIADLAVGLNAGQIKTGAPCRGERTAKYNRLLKIESEIL